VIIIAIFSDNIVATTSIDENAVSRSYINKHSSSWRSFAIANDVTKREKLKKALRDALRSVVTDERKSDISRNIEVENSSIDRIKHAASLLKEFQQIHKLSETVKRTLVEYKTAKNNLNETINMDSGVGLLKRFLLGRTKRTFVPHTNKNFNTRNLILDKPHYLKHTNKISVIATPLKVAGGVGVEYISVDPKTSTLERAQKAFRAANILLKFVGSKRGEEGKPVDGLVEKLRKDIDGLYKEVDNPNQKKSVLASKANNLFISRDDANRTQQQASLSHITELTTTKKRVIQPSQEVVKNDQDGDVNNSTKRSEKADMTVVVDEKEKEESKLKEEVQKENKPVVQDIPSNAADLLQAKLKQEETLQTLKEAKLARQKYEIARHELAQKVKELYKMANDYEKEETDNQVLEVKNDNIPKAINSSQSLEDNVNVPHTKRDDAHPGMALSGVSNHATKHLLTATEVDNGEHKAFTMGAIDKKQHQVSTDEIKQNEAKTSDPSKTISSMLPSKRKIVDTAGVPSNLKIDELKDEVSKNMKTQQESLKVIAQAIKEDMKDIANVNQKKKMVADAMSNNNASKKDKQSNDKLDEYLTKALSDIMGGEAVPGNEAGKDAEQKQSERVEKSQNTKEENMKIVAQAMKSSSDKNLQLPLLTTSGDKIKATGTSHQRDTNDIVQHVSDHDNNNVNNKKPLEINDPANVALLDKASHLEEQVAAQQDQLYNGRNLLFTLFPYYS